MEVNSIDYHYHNAPRNPTDIELGVEPGYKQSISYINNTHIPIFIRDKTDLVIELLPENHIYNNDLKIIFTFEFNHLMIPNLNKFFSSLFAPFLSDFSLFHKNHLIALCGILPL